MAYLGSFSRSLRVAARSSSSSFRSPPAVPRLRSDTFSGHRIPRRRLPLPTSRNFGQLGCAQSLLPLHSAVAAARLTPHLSISPRACCEVSQGT